MRKERTLFGFGIKIIQDEDRTEYASTSLNKGLALEVAIQRIKMLLFQLEKDYVNTFDKTHSRIDDK